MAGGLLATLLAACADLAYYLQSATGQARLLVAAQPIDRLLAAPDLPPQRSEKLRQLRSIRDFASVRLGLPDNAAYRRVSEIGRPYVVWNVFAAPRLSVRLIEHCFPIAGCVPYRGYFAEADARAYAARLARRGYDVYVGGVPAYSTLGWFADPLPSSVLHYADSELARLVFHELAHQVVYVPGEATFNESFATAVELEGVRRWLGAQAKATDEFDRATERRRQFIALIAGTREKLRLLYEGAGESTAKELGKIKTLAALRADYANLKGSWGGFSGYDRWFEGGLNNAALASLGTYTDLLPAFQNLLRASGGDLPRFYREVQRLAALDAAAREAALAAALVPPA